jgi:FkbM family methyltransferase
MKVFNKSNRIFFFIIYYLIHKNFLFGYFHKKIIKKFYYKKFIFNLAEKSFSISSHSSFFFKTYEYNDRKIIEKYITNKNKCIIIGGGIGFIATLAFHLSNQKILVFEINKKILSNLDRNLKKNNCTYKIYNKNLCINSKDRNNKNKFYINKDFLSSSFYLKSGTPIKVKNLTINNIKDFKSFNTLIVDGEGIEEYFIKNLSKMKNIKYIFFELHHNIFNKSQINEIFKNLRIQKFNIVDKCFNSYFFKKN